MPVQNPVVDLSDSMLAMKLQEEENDAAKKQANNKQNNNNNQAQRDESLARVLADAEREQQFKKLDTQRADEELAKRLALDEQRIVAEEKKKAEEAKKRADEASRKRAEDAKKKLYEDEALAKKVGGRRKEATPTSPRFRRCKETRCARKSQGVPSCSSLAGPSTFRCPQSVPTKSRGSNSQPQLLLWKHPNLE